MKKDRTITRDGEVTHIIQYEVSEHNCVISFSVWRSRVVEGVTEYQDEAADIFPSFQADRDKACCFMRGTLRFDGCVDLTFPDIGISMLHFCGPEEEPELGIIMKAIYSLGPEMLRWMDGL